MMVVISQPRYLPALNYLQRLHFADKFVLLDIVQRQSRGWENRNQLLLPNPTWLTIPISSSSRALIKDTQVAGSEWMDYHKARIRQHYRKAPFFNADILDLIYKETNNSTSFTSITRQMLTNTCDLLGFTPKLIHGSDLSQDILNKLDGPSKLAGICKLIGADCYISGPNGKAYGIEEAFKTTGIDVYYHRFTHPVYHQLSSCFSPYMGFIDALFMCGVEWLSDFVRQSPDLVKSL